MEGCPGRVATRTAMQMHFLHRHVLDTVVILEEGNLPRPRCTRCDMMFPRQALNGRHPATAQCARGFRMTFRAKGGLRSCPMEGCPGRVATRTEMRVHFLHRNVLNTVVILEEEKLPHPRCA